MSKREPYPGFSRDATIVKALAAKHLMPSDRGLEEAARWLAQHATEEVPVRASMRERLDLIAGGYDAMSRDTRQTINRATVRALARGKRTWGDVLAQMDEMLPF